MPDATSFFPVGGMPTASSLAWKISLRKTDAGEMRRLRSVALYLWLIVVDIRQATDRCRNIWASLPGAVGGCSSIRLTAHCKNSKKRAERSERLMYEQSHRDYLRSGYLHHRSPAAGWVIINVITPILATKPSATKNARELKLANAQQLLTCRCGMMLLRLDAKYTKELADAKAENDALRDDVAAGRRRLCNIKAVCQSVRSHHRLRRG